MSTIFESLTGLALLDPWMLLLALLVPLLLWIKGRTGTPAIRFGPGRFLQGEIPSPADPDERRDSGEAGDGMPRSWRIRLRPAGPLFQVLGLLLVVACLARPVHRIQLPLETRGIDILLCLDLSSSMTANDMDERRTRLEVARDAASRFITHRASDRIGLLCFARYPDLRCPLTLDHNALIQILDNVDMVESDGPEDATGIGTAVARAAQVLERGRADSRVVILLTDGEENVATAQTPGEIAPIHAAQLCAQREVRVYTIAAGSGHPDQNGEWIPLDTTQVERVAERTDGRFYKARNAEAVTRIYDDIDALEKVELEEPRYRVEERFVSLLIAAMALLLAGHLLETTVLEVQP